MNAFKRLASKPVKTIKIDEEDVNVYRLTGSTILSAAGMAKKAARHVATLFQATETDVEKKIVQDDSGGFIQHLQAVSLDMANMRNDRRDNALDALGKLLEPSDAPAILASLLRDTFRDEFTKEMSDTDVLESFSVDDLAEALKTIVEVNEILGKLKGTGIIQKVKKGMEKVETETE